MKHLLLLSLTVFSSVGFGDSDLQRVQTYNSSYVAGQYLQYLASGQVPGFADTQVCSGQRMVVCGESIIISNDESGSNDDLKTTYVSVPVCLEGDISTPAAYLISECFMKRYKTGRYGHAIRAECQIVNGRSY